MIGVGTVKDAGAAKDLADRFDFGATRTCPQEAGDTKHSTQLPLAAPSRKDSMLIKKHNMKPVKGLKET